MIQRLLISERLQKQRYKQERDEALERLAAFERSTGKTEVAAMEE